MSEPLNTEPPEKIRQINYLVASYLDLKDVVDTVEKMIMSDPTIKYPTPVRKQCQVSVIPLKSTSGFILRFKVPESLINSKI